MGRDDTGKDEETEWGSGTRCYFGELRRRFELNVNLRERQVEAEGERASEELTGKKAAVNR